MNVDFSNITILGGGLLGGSLAMALAKRDTPPGVHLWMRKQETLQAARERGLEGATCDLTLAVSKADLLVLAVPVGAMATLLAQALEAGLPSTCLVTDVGSVKHAPHQCLAPLLAGRCMDFIGSHPMAGSECSGLAAACPDLFQQAACLLTNDEQVPPARTDSLDRFWQSVGCRTTWTSAAAHDALVARISHLPHIMAACAARICLQDPADGRFGGGGLRDTTRVASGKPEMWAEILVENRAALLEPLRASIEDLSTLLAHLEIADQESALHWLAAAKRQRDILYPPA